jgi:transglutaminase-like putative cysteine protease
LFIVIIIYSIFGEHEQLFIHKVINFLPIVFYPLLITEYYSDKKITPLGALIYSYRKRNSNNSIKIGYIFFVECLLASSVMQLHKEVFMVVFTLLISWALWNIKKPSVSNVKWISIFTVVIFLSYISQDRLKKIASYVEDWAVEYINEIMHGVRDPFRSRTAMGKVGELKLSNKIIMRVKTRNKQPILLEEVIYDSFYNNVWFSSLNQFDPIENYVVVDDETSNQEPITVYRSTRYNKSLLALPAGSTAISVAKKVKLFRSGHGTTKAENTKDFFKYIIYKVDLLNSETKAKPTHVDTIIPITYRKIISEINYELELRGRDKMAIVSRISNYFRKHYRYSLIQKQTNSKKPALVRFLSDQHYGHCEFFASATVLLLRSANIPTRYVVGYSASEYDSNDKLFIVRARDSHAWAQAYINGQWINIDNTPSIWYQHETENASVFEPITDLFSKLHYYLNLWIASNDDQEFLYFIIFLITAVIVLIVVLKRMGKGLSFKDLIIFSVSGNKKPDDRVEHQSRRLMNRVIQESGYPRYQHEPLLVWHRRFSQVTHNAQITKELLEIIQVYYELRFSSMNPLSVQSAFENKVDEWLSNRVN